MSRYQCFVCGAYACAKGLEDAKRLLRPQCATFDEHSPRPLLADSDRLKQAQLAVVE